MPLVENSESEGRCSFRLRRVGAAATFPGISDTFKVNKEVVVVGRNPSSSDIFLDSSKDKALISRLHARIITEKNDCGNCNFKISDTSLNGTYVNDVKIASSCDLKPGDTVTFGHIQGAVLRSGMLAQQPNSEFRFLFESYPSSPPDKKHKNSKGTPSPEHKSKNGTLSPSTLKLTSMKTPSFPADHLPNLSAFLTPRTPTSAGPSSPLNKLRIPGSTNVMKTWQQYISDTSSSDNSDDDLMAYAAAAGKAMEEDSDEDVFSIQLPHDSPVFATEENRIQLTSKGVVTKTKTSKNKPVGNAVVRSEKRPYKAPLKRSRKANTTTKKAPRKCAKNNEQESTDYMYNTCASVDCVHPHDQDKVVDWVQCDDCDVWYHVKCTGLTLKSVKHKSAKFHCGCV